MTQTDQIMLCYGKFNSYRVATLAMQAITELYQFVFRVVTHPSVHHSSAKI